MGEVCCGDTHFTPTPQLYKKVLDSNGRFLLSVDCKLMICPILGVLAALLKADEAAAKGLYCGNAVARYPHPFPLTALQFSFSLTPPPPCLYRS